MVSAPETINALAPALQGRWAGRGLMVTRPDGLRRQYGQAHELSAGEDTPGNGLVQLRRRGLGASRPVWHDNGSYYELTWAYKREYQWREPLICPEALEAAPADLRAWIKGEWVLCREVSCFERLLAEPALHSCLYRIGTCYGSVVSWQ